MKCANICAYLMVASSGLDPPPLPRCRTARVLSTPATDSAANRRVDLLYQYCLIIAGLRRIGTGLDGLDGTYAVIGHSNLSEMMRLVTFRSVNQTLVPQAEAVEFPG